MRSVSTRILLLAVGVLVHAGCTSHRAPSLADRFFLHRNTNPALRGLKPPSRRRWRKRSQDPPSDGHCAARAAAPRADR